MARIRIFRTAILLLRRPHWAARISDPLLDPKVSLRFSHMPHAFPAISVRQPLGEFYLAALPAELLLAVAFSERHTLKEADPSGSVTLTGHQRRLDPKRLKEIANYVRTADAALPSTIILAANCSPTGEILDPSEPRRWSVKATGDGIVTLEIPTDEKLAAIVDGQHRLFGFDELKGTNLARVALPCAVFLDLPTPQQAALFATINYNQKPVSKSATYQLFGYNLDDEPPESWSPDKLAVFLTRKLNVDEQSPLKDRIQVAAQDDRVLDQLAKSRAKEWSVSTATMVEAIMRLISTKPKDDRDLLHRHPIGAGRHRSVLPGAAAMPNAPLRGLYIEVRDIVIYGIVLNFLRASSSVFWEHATPGFIRKTVGIQALFDLLRDLVAEQLETKDLTEAVWRGWLKQAAHVDFTDNFFYPSGGGRIRVRDALLIATGRKKLEDLPADRRTDLERLTKA